LILCVARPFRASGWRWRKRPLKLLGNVFSGSSRGMGSTLDSSGCGDDSGTDSMLGRMHAALDPGRRGLGRTLQCLFELGASGLVLSRAMSGIIGGSCAFVASYCEHGGECDGYCS
jgi:hypothetical protein